VKSSGPSGADGILSLKIFEKTSINYGLSEGIKLAANPLSVPIKKWFLEVAF
jgi:hypothetical protein